jgi:hypothetical protein
VRPAHGNAGWKHPDVSPSLSEPAKLATPFAPTMCPSANCAETTFPVAGSTMIHQTVTG